MRRITVDLPDQLVERVDAATQESGASSRNRFIAESLEARVEALERARIDAEFATLRDDTEWQEEMRAMAEEAVPAGWQALRLDEEEGV